nr:toll-like receptor Tollo [Lytechinus pictus]
MDIVRVQDCLMFLGVLLSLSSIVADNLPSKTKNVNRRDHGSARMARSYPISCNVADLPCLCNGPTQGTGPLIEFTSISCFLSSNWNVTLQRIPRTRSLTLNCHSHGNRTNDPADLKVDLFDNLSGVLQELTMIGCKIGSFPSEIFADMALLQKLLLVSADLDGDRLEAIGGIKTNASVKLSLNPLHSLDVHSFGFQLSNISTLDLSFNNIEEIGIDTFMVFPSLRKLFLGNNSISFVIGDAFRGLQRLTELNIRSNNNLFNDDSRCLFQNTASLITVDLSSTGLTNASQFNCAPLLHVRRLIIHDNNLPTLDGYVFVHMPNITFIDLSNNVLEYVHPNAFHGGLNELKYVNMSGNDLREFPVFAFKSTPNIRLINISHNHLRVIRMGTFSSLPSLQTIDLSFNRLQTIEVFGIVNLGSLTMIDLRYNDFVLFPDNLVWPFDIRPPHIPIDTLLRGNSFTCGCPVMLFIRRGDFEYTYPFFHLPDNSSWTCNAPSPVVAKSMMTLPLEDFWCPYENNTCKQGSCECYRRDIDRANIFFCPNNSLHSLPNIPAETLIFDCNGCLIDDHNTLRAEDFQTSAKLAVLALRDIGLETIVSDALLGFPNLQQLNLSNNVLNRFDDNILTDLTDLREIDLSRNGVNSLSSRTFDRNPNLTTIYIHSNDLQSLEDGIFNSTSHLKVLTLHDNPFICNCSLFWLKQWLQSHIDVVPRLYDVECYVNSSDNTMYPIIQVADQDFGCSSPDVLTIQEYNAVIATSSLTLVFLMIMAVTFRHRRAIRVILYTRYGFHVLHDDDDDDVVLDNVRWEYDAYIAYSDEDIEYVLKNIIPILEEDVNLPYKLCIRHRDFPPGECIATTIVTSLEASRRSIIVISRSFLQDEWRLLEFKTAHQRVLQDKRNKNLILVFLEDLDKDEMDEDMRYYVTANAYLSTTNRLFRENLLYEMPRHPLAEIHGDGDHQR